MYRKTKGRQSQGKRTLKVDEKQSMVGLKDKKSGKNNTCSLPACFLGQILPKLAW